MIQAVKVVPILAPMMIDMAWARVSRPAETNETVMTVVADDDCTAQVTNAPVSIPEKRLEVIRAKIWRKLEPAIFCKASLIIFMPKMSSAKEPRSLKIMSKVMFYNSNAFSIQR